MNAMKLRLAAAGVAGCLCNPRLAGWLAGWLAG